MWITNHAPPELPGSKKFTAKYVGPYWVIDALSDIHFRIQEKENSHPKVVHHDRSKPYVFRQKTDTPEWVIRLSRELSAAELARAAERRSEPAPKAPVPDQPRVPTGSCAVSKVKLPPMVPTVTGKPTEPSTQTNRSRYQMRYHLLQENQLVNVRYQLLLYLLFVKQHHSKRRGKARNVSALLYQKKSPPKPNRK